MKKYFSFLAAIMIGAIVFTGCKKDKPEPTVIDTPVYGMQIKGTATGNEVLVIDEKQMVEPSSDYSVKVEREGMLYGIHYLVAGDFTIKNVLANSEVAYGLDNVEEVTQEAETVEPIVYKKAKLTEGGTAAFTVAEEGLYYIITDATTAQMWIMKINNFELSANGDKAVFVEGSAEGATFKLEATDLRAKFKVRMNTAWKFIFEDVPFTGEGGAEGDHCRPVISYGGALDALTAEGNDIEVDNGGQLLNFTFTWNPESTGMKGITATTEGAGELPPAEFPDEIYVVGSATAYGWDTPGSNANAIMHKIAGDGNDGIYWKICHVVGGEGFKVSGADWGAFNTGFAEVNEFDAEGLNIVDASGNLSIEESGMVMIVVDFRDDMVKLSVRPAEVYGMGPTFGGWDTGVATNLFKVDNENKVLNSPALVADDNIRMYAAHPWIADWWQAEFNVYEGAIVYRGNGGDQEAVPGTTGQVISLMFDDNTGVIQ